jgi:hypothetical protein
MPAVHIVVRELQAPVSVRFSRLHVQLRQHAAELKSAAAAAETSRVSDSTEGMGRGCRPLSIKTLQTAVAAAAAAMQHSSATTENQLSSESTAALRTNSVGSGAQMGIIY